MLYSLLAWWYGLQVSSLGDTGGCKVQGTFMQPLRMCIMIPLRRRNKQTTHTIRIFRFFRCTQPLRMCMIPLRRRNNKQTTHIIRIFRFFRCYRGRKKPFPTIRFKNPVHRGIFPNTAPSVRCHPEESRCQKQSVEEENRPMIESSNESGSGYPRTECVTPAESLISWQRRI
jgi:hypothetical protein